MSSGPNSKTEDQPRNFTQIMIPFYVVIPFALIATAFGAGHFRASLAALLWATGCLAVGTCIGFLFGIPKTIQGDKIQERQVAQSSGKNSSDDRAYRSIVNTNLVEISDWLTKIIVGLGLINLKAIPGFALKISRVLSSSLVSANCGLGGNDYLAFAAGVIISFTAIGFLFGYLFTRLYLAAAFVRADLDGLASMRETADATSGSVESVRESVAVLNEKVKQIEAQPSQITTERPAEVVEKAAAKDFPEANIQTAISPATSLAPAYESQLLELAKEYNEFRSNTREDRVRARDDFASRMAVIINGNSGARAWATDLAQKEGNVGLIAGLATAMNAVPQPGDPDKIFQLAGRVPFKHARYRVATALGRLFESGIATSADIARARRILSIYFTEDPDESLQRRVRYTLAQISKAVGKTVELEE